MTLPGRNLAGSSDDGRPANDFYPTPAYVTKALMAAEDIRHYDIWEPACGDGAMSNVLAEANHKVYVSDLEPRLEGAKVADFLERGNHPTVEPMNWIITNPPFKLAAQFVERAKAYDPDKIAMFLKIQFLEGIGRRDLLLDTKFPLARIHVFSKRVSLTRNGLPMKNGGTMCFAWFVWDKGHEGPATFHLL